MKELKSLNENRFIGECCLFDKLIDKDSVLVCINSNTCKKCSLPIHVKRSSKMGWNHNNFYYCCHECMIGKQMNVKDYPFKFVTHYNNEIYYCFLKDEDTN